MLAGPVMARRSTLRTDFSQPPDDRTYSPEVTSFEQSPGSSQFRGAGRSLPVAYLPIIKENSPSVKREFDVFYKIYMDSRFWAKFFAPRLESAAGEPERQPGLVRAPGVPAVRSRQHTPGFPGLGIARNAVYRLSAVRPPGRLFETKETATARQAGPVAYLLGPRPEASRKVRI